MRKLLLNPTPLFRKLRQLSMLLSLLLALPQTAWGKRYTTTGNVTDVTASYTAGTRFTWNTNATETSTWQWVIDCEAGTVTPGSTLTFTLEAGKNITMYFGGSANPNSTNVDRSNLRKFTFDGLSDELTVSAALTQESTTYNFTGSNGVFTPSGNTNSIDMNGVLNVTITNNSGKSVTCTINSITVLTGQIISSDELVWPTDSPITELTKSVSNNVTTLSGSCAADTEFSFLLKIDGGSALTENDNYAIKYTSSNPSVAEVSDAGLVTIKGSGSTIITATLTENDYYSYAQSTYSYTLTNTETYGLTIAGTAVTSTNAANVFGSAGTATVSFTPATGSNTTNTLTLNGYQNVSSNAAIVSSLPNLTIVINGESSIGDNSGTDGYIQSTNDNATLTFKKGSDNSTLTLHASNSDAVVQGFASVSYDEAYYSYSSAINYNTTDKRYENRYSQLQFLTITTTPHYPIWVEAIQVSDTNKNNLANGKATFTPGTNTTPNILLLDNAYISSMTAIESGLDSLTISLIGDNTLSTYYIGYNPIYSVNPSATLTIKNAGDAICYLHMRTQQSNDAVIKGFASVSYDGLNYVSKTGTTLYNDATHDADISSSGIYPLWINDNVVTDENKASNATIVYDNGTNILTLNGYTYTAVAADGPTIETNISGLKVKLKGASNSINCIDNSSFAFCTYQPSTASIQFVRDDASSKLTIATTGESFYGFANDKVTYDGLFYYSSSGNEKYITQAAAPVISKATIYDATAQQAYTFAKIDYATSDKDNGNVKYASANPKLMYSFDYADANLTDVTNAEYPGGNGIKMLSPGILTTWVEIGSYKSPESKGVRFGFLENPIEMEFNGAKKQISVTPAPTMTNAVTPSVSSDYSGLFNNFATLDAANKITIKSCYDGKIGFIFDNGDGYTSLNDSTLVTFKITPPKPTISVPGGTYDAAQTVTIASNYQGTGATIKYYFGENPTAEETYDADLSITETKKLTAWVVVNGVKSDTVQAPYTIRQAANLSYSATTATAKIQASGTTFTAPTLNNPSSINDITYSSSNEQVATISNTGDVTILGAGTTTISAKATNETIYTPTPAEYALTVTRVISNPFSNAQAGQNYATYYSNTAEDLALPAGLEAYIVTGVSGASVVVTSVSYLPHATPILLQKTADLNADIEIGGYDGTAGNFAGNLLKYTNTNPGVNTTGKEYILYKNEFVKATGTISGACYLDLNGVAPTRGMYGIGNDGSTAIEGIDVEATKDEEWYDLQGRRIQKPTKAGIYIVNGKKVIINKK